MRRVSRRRVRGSSPSSRQTDRISSAEARPSTASTTRPIARVTHRPVSTPRTACACRPSVAATACCNSAFSRSSSFTCAACMRCTGWLASPLASMARVAAMAAAWYSAAAGCRRPARSCLPAMPASVASTARVRSAAASTSFSLSLSPSTAAACSSRRNCSTPCCARRSCCRAGASTCARRCIAASVLAPTRKLTATPMTNTTAALSGNIQILVRNFTRPLPGAAGPRLPVLHEGGGCQSSGNSTLTDPSTPDFSM